MLCSLYTTMYPIFHKLGRQRVMCFVFIGFIVPFTLIYFVAFVHIVEQSVSMDISFPVVPAKNDDNNGHNDYYFDKMLHELQIRSNLTDCPQRSFDKFIANKTFPCFQIDRDKPDIGNLYFKLRKSASSTLAGIALRIAHNHKIIKSETSKPCYTSSNHGRASFLKLKQRDESNSILWSFIRHPTKRFTSDFYFERVSRKFQTRTPSLAQIKYYYKFINGRTIPYNFGYQLGYISLKIPFKPSAFGSAKNKSCVKNFGKLYRHVQRTLDSYNFIGITERLDESLVVMRMLFNLPADDILYISSKKTGAFDAGGKDGICSKIKKAKFPSDVEAYFKSREWFARNIGDFLLYKAVNKSLDLTIEHAIGRKKFEEAFKEHMYLLKLVQEKCEPIAVFPCSENGVFQENISNSNCYFKDQGCGYPCIDELFSNYTSNNIF